MSAQVNHSMFCRRNGGICECEDKYLTASSTISPVLTQRSDPLPLPPPPSLPPPFLPESTLNSRAQAIFNDLPEQELLKAMAMFRSRKQKDITQALTNAAVGSCKASTGGSDHSHLPSGLSTQASSNTSMIFHVSSVAMVAPFRKMFASEVQAMKNRGCFISATSSKGGITVNTAWSYTEVDKQVCKWFLPVFTYLAKAPHQKQPSWSSSWLLCQHSGNSFSIVEVAEPNRSTLFENKGCGKAGIADSALWFVIRKSILDETYDSWNKELLIIGSDSEFELDSIQNDSQDSSLVIKDIISAFTDSTSDLDVKLSSSMLDLAMSTVLKDKGKSVLKKHEDPIMLPHKPVSSTPTIVSVSEDDVILWGRHFPDSPNASTAVNLWHPASE
ncbi:hypothetical protein HD554DRAFT_2087760 [Boletus coccyginus]|nr:hypothetical protein HD554DRAFT_2087760 [Boletus coccyginus]